MNTFSPAVLLFTVWCAAAGYCAQEAPRNISFKAGQPDVVSFMTFNIRANNIMDSLDSWRSRKKLVFDVIEHHAPDIFGLQEPLYNQLMQVQQAFKQYACYWAGGRDGKNGGESCPIFFRKDRFKLIDSGTFWFSNHPDKPGTKSWGHIVPRFCSWVRLVQKGQHTSFYVYNTHLDSLSQNSREKSVRLLAKEIAARGTLDPFIVMGDYNMRLINPAMMFLLTDGPENRCPVVDAWLSVHPSQLDRSTSNFGTWGTGPQLDHIQLGTGITPLGAQIDNRKFDGHYPSDHFPVVAQVMLPLEKPTAAATSRKDQQYRAIRTGGQPILRNSAGGY